ncbi:unnamed protein product, partial [Polarella glacialis]
SGLAVSLVTLEDLPYTIELMTFLGHKLQVADAKALADLAKAEVQNRVPLLGSMPGLDHEVETLNHLLNDDGTLIKSLYKSMMASYHLYNKTRPSASKSSVTRSKQMLEDCGGPARLQGLIHPAFHDADSATTHGRAIGAVGEAGADLSYIQELRGYRPKVEKIGNVLSTIAMRTMEQAKLDAFAVSSIRETAAAKDAMPTYGSDNEDDDVEPENSTTFGGSSPSSAGRKGLKRPLAGSEAATPVRAAPVKPVKPKGPRTSKRARKQSGPDTAGGDDPGDFEVTIDGADWNGKGPKSGKSQKMKEPDVQFYLSVDRDVREEAKEKGLEMEQYQMDLMPDDSSNIQKAKSVIRWDAKKKKYLPTMVSVDGKVLKGQRRNESGQIVKGEAEKSAIYNKWSKATKNRIQKIGELEEGVAAARTADPLGKLKKSQARTVEFGADGEVSGYGSLVPPEGEMVNGRLRKPIVPFHGTVEEKHLTHKQKRMFAKRSKEDGVSSKGSGKGKKSELKSVTELQKDKKQKDKNQLKQKPHLRKARSKANKESRMAMREERSMKFGAKTKAKMLIIEGPKKWVKKKAPPQKGYGSRSSF